MRLYTITNDEITEHARTRMAKEKEIEDFLEKHPQIIGKDITIVGRQVQTGSMGVIDLLGIDKSGRIVVIEIKKGTTSRDVISQILHYAQWAEGISYEELNQIASIGHLGGHNDLYKKLESKFGRVPQFRNDSQRMFIVGEEIDGRTESVCAYLNRNGIKINCMRISFYKNDGGQVISTDIIMGDGDEDEYEDEPSEIDGWEQRVANAVDENKKAVMELIERLKSDLKCHGAISRKYYKLSTSDNVRGTEFARIILNKKTATFAFRVDPDQFDLDDARIRSVKGWFFRSESRAYITVENQDLLMACARHAFEAAEKVNSVAANKASATKRDSD